MNIYKQTDLQPPHKDRFFVSDYTNNIWLVRVKGVSRRSWVMEGSTIHEVPPLFDSTIDLLQLRETEVPKFIREDFYKRIH